MYSEDYTWLIANQGDYHNTHSLRVMRNLRTKRNRISGLGCQRRLVWVSVLGSR